jgi:hypothetical protein
MKKRLIIIIGCDCDPDRAKYGGDNLMSHHGEYKWQGIKKGIPQIKEQLLDIQSGFDSSLKFTWCVRSDLQIEKIYGNAGWCVKEFSSLWRKLEEEGDEIGWHPHLARWNSERKLWFQEIKDEQWIKQCIAKGFTAFKENWGKPPVSCRMGWVFHNNLTMEQIAALGIKVDFSAIPDLSKSIISRKDTVYIQDYADWKETPIYPYHPSRLDYRLPAKDKNLGVWEIPCMAVHSNLLMWLYSFDALTRGKGIIQLRPIFPAMIAMFPSLFKKALHHRLRINEFKKNVFLATYFHADELLSWKREFLIKNLVHIQNVAHLHKMEVHFVTAFESSDFLKEES